MCWILTLFSSLGASEVQFLLSSVLESQPHSVSLDFGFALKCSAQKVTPYRLKLSTPGSGRNKRVFQLFPPRIFVFFSSFFIFVCPLAGSTDNVNDNDIDEQEEDEDKKEDQEVGKEAEGRGSQNCKTKSATHPPLIQSFDPQIITQKMMKMMMPAMTNKSGTLNVNLAAAHIRDHSFPIWSRHLD